MQCTKTDKMSIVLFVIFACISRTICQNATSDFTTNKELPNSTVITSTISSTESSEVHKNDSCTVYSTCEECVKRTECYFCKDGNRCILYTMKDLIPTDQCDVKSVNYKTCKVSFLAIIIMGSVAVGLVLISLICCCCCCCRRGGRLRFSKDDLKWARQREERKARAEERRKERAEKTLEIRRKYGLFKEDTPYQRFDS